VPQRATGADVRSDDGIRHARIIPEPRFVARGALALSGVRITIGVRAVTR
jgi:hypothetical protein